MKKTKLDPNKIIKVRPRMVKEGVDANPLLLIIIGMALLLFLISCDEQPKVEQKPKEPLELSKDSENYHLKVTEYTYEGCGYIRVGYGQSTWGSHKGNCENPIHKGQHPSPYMLESSALEYYENKNSR